MKRELKTAEEKDPRSHLGREANCKKYQKIAFREARDRKVISVRVHFEVYERSNGGLERLCRPAKSPNSRMGKKDEMGCIHQGRGKSILRPLGETLKKVSGKGKKRGESEKKSDKSKRGRVWTPIKKECSWKE